MKDPYTEYLHLNVDPVWDEVRLGAREQLADMLAVLGLPVVHRKLLRVALPGRMLRVGLSGRAKGRGSSGSGESQAFSVSLRRLDNHGLICRDGDELVHVLDPQGLYEYVLHAEQPRMPRDGYARALNWAQDGGDQLHRQEVRRLQEVLAERDEEGGWG